MPPQYDKLLILDLDETLIHTTNEPKGRTPDFQVFHYGVYKRPGVEDFLSTCIAWFNMGVWTSASADYAGKIIQHLFPEPAQLRFVFTRKDCGLRFDYSIGMHRIVKPLKKLKKQGYSLKKTLVIDDSPGTFVENYGNAILVQKYLGNEEDEELFLLLKYLETIASAKNVRKIEKGNWREQV
jgi:RNA polymerase II subunit A small phosphatase-like protein